jgi:hypothetical protein
VPSEGLPQPGAIRALHQVAEYTLALVLVGSALHAGGGARLFVVAAVVVGGWAAIHDAPLRATPMIGSGVHRAGLVVIAVTLAGAPVALGRLSDLAVSGPAVLVAVLLLQLARLSRRRTQSAGDTAAFTGAEPVAARPAPGLGRPTSYRRAGQIAAQTGTVVTKQAERAVPVGARHAGRLVGRFLPRRSPQ